MQLNVQKRLAGHVSNCSPNRVKFNTQNLAEIKEAITKADIRRLIKQGLIVIEQKQGISRFRARKIITQRRKGRKKGMGSRKGASNVRHHRKQTWIYRIRLQRTVLHNLLERNVINREVYRELYSKATGGFFRSKHHIQLYIEERGLGRKEK